MKITANNPKLVVTALLLAIGGYMATGRGWSAGDVEEKDTPRINGFAQPTTGIWDPPNIRTKSIEPKIIVSLASGSATTGKVQYIVDGGVPQNVDGEPKSAGLTIQLPPLKDGEKHTISVTWAPKDANGTVGPPVKSPPVDILVDNAGPVLKRVDHEYAPDGVSVLTVTFDENLKKDVAIADLAILQETTRDQYQTPVSYPDRPEVKGATAIVKLGKRAPARYQLVVATTLADQLGNPAKEQKQGFSVPQLPLPADARLTITPAGTTHRTDGGELTHAEKLSLGISGTNLPTGKLTPFVNGIAQSEVTYPGGGNTIEVTLTNEGENSLNVSFTDSERHTIASNTIIVKLDTVGPLLEHVQIVEAPVTTGTGTTLLATFADDDFMTEVTPDYFRVKRQAGGGAFDGTAFGPQTAEVEGRTIRLSSFTPSLPAGEYEFEVIGTGAGLKDQAGNPAGRRGATDKAGKNQKTVFSVLADRKFGQHVEFPLYAPPKKQTIPPEGFNPDDYVQTRVARLYYYRDAHRVAEIINRNIRSYNQAAVTLAERRAEAARDDFEDKVDSRRKSEREAVLAAQASRTAESKLADAREIQGIAAQIEAELKSLELRKKSITEELAEGNKLDEIARGDNANATNKEQQADGARNSALAAEQKANKAASDYNLATTRLNEARALNSADPNIPNLERDRADKAQFASDAQAAATTAAATATTLAQEARELRTKADQSRAVAVARSAAVQSDKLRLELTQIDADTKRLREQQAKIGTPSSLQNSIQAMEQSIANLRQTENVETEKSQGAQAAEDRAAAKKFRAEVTAAEADPDTYVAGDINSVDPVTQVSISVIGEGLIQLRGPIKGINKVRIMINEIDSPVGQIKIGIFTVQVNGEKGDKMEKVIGDAEGHIDLSRFLVNQSLELVRRSIQTEAAMIAEQCEMEGHYQVDRDRRYLYTFFGRDFIDELYEMNSEFLSTENKLLSLNSMDTVSLNRALFILALAKNDVRERIVARFLESAQTDLADAEYDFRRSSELKPFQTQKKFPPWNLTHLPVWNRPHVEEIIYEAVHRNAMQRYHFRNVRGFFDVGFTNPDTMNPMQREFIRLAQIFKARLVAEMELKQRVIERGLIEDRSNDEEKRAEIVRSVHDDALEDLRCAYQSLLNSIRQTRQLSTALKKIRDTIGKIPTEKDLDDFIKPINEVLNDPNGKLEQKHALVREVRQMGIDAGRWLKSEDSSKLKPTLEGLDPDLKQQTAGLINASSVGEAWNELAAIAPPYRDAYNRLQKDFDEFQRVVESEKPTLDTLDRSYADARIALDGIFDTPDAQYLTDAADAAYRDRVRAIQVEGTIAFIETFLNRTRGPLDHRKLLDHLIDEQEEKFIELVEGTRSHIAVMDSYLKRLSIALEDDFKVQFYDPAFVRVRDAARSQEVNLGQVERTTILTNNRAFAKVEPQATMEFDLPKRQIAIKEAFDAAKALVEDTGALVNDPTFLAAFQMMGGGPQASTVKAVVPAQSSSTNQQDMGLVPPPQDAAAPGSALQSLVPEPAIYKLETGTGFQIKPVIQPDGDSVVYDFDYMYTTNIREPVRADEKHVGRIKRHFVHTEVQTSSFELREISRYLVALKVSRTSRGVPLLEDIPVLGAAFKPAPSAESSIQQNIILGQTTVYPTLFDLMGLRWAPQVADLDYAALREAEHVVRGRQKAIRDYVFEESSARVDGFLDLKKKTPQNYRPDLYREQTLSSPNHPSGYSYPYAPKDPTGNDYERFDRRPEEMQDPPYDRYRHQPVYPERIEPQAAPESVPLQPSQVEPIQLQAPSGTVEENGMRSDSQDSLELGGGGATYRHSIRGRFDPIVRASFEETVREENGQDVRRLPPVSP